MTVTFTIENKFYKSLSKSSLPKVLTVLPESTKLDDLLAQ